MPHSLMTCLLFHMTQPFLPFSLCLPLSLYLPFTLSLFHTHLLVRTIAARTRVLQYAAVCCSMLQCVAVCYSMGQYGAAWCNVMQGGSAWCIVVQCVAVCCSVLQCGAVWCSVILECVCAEQASSFSRARSLARSLSVSHIYSLTTPDIECDN